jgi:uncharacterized membrane protein
MKNNLNEYLSDEDLEVITSEIKNIELKTSGELRLSLRSKRYLHEKLYKPHELAVKDFEDMGMANTKDKTGILLFVLFEERYYHILADEGIHGKIPDTVWGELENNLKENFRMGMYKDGIIFVIRKMGKILATEFPRKEYDINELPDEVYTGESNFFTRIFRRQ